MQKKMKLRTSFQNQKVSKMKGLSLPIEMIVIIAIAVLVLVVIAAFFVGGAGKLSTTDDTSALGQGCQQWRVKSCGGSPSSIPIQGYNPTGTKPDDSLQTACTRLGYTGTDWSDPQSCLRACGCSQR